MLAEQRAVGAEVEDRVVDGAAVALVHRDREVARRARAAIAPSASHAGPGTSTDWSNQRAYHSPSAHGVVRHTQSGYVGDEGLGERDERGAPCAGGLLREPADLLDRGVPVAEDRGGLDGGDGARFP